MPLPIKLQKDYTQNAEGYQLKLPLNIETIIPEDDSVRLLMLESDRNSHPKTSRINQSESDRNSQS